MLRAAAHRSEALESQTPGLSSDHDKSFMVDYQHTFSPSLLTDARFAFSRLIISELQPDYNTNAATTNAAFRTLTWVRSTRQACHR